jgi:hypothetical protein
MFICFPHFFYTWDPSVVFRCQSIQFYAIIHLSCVHLDFGDNIESSLLFLELHSHSSTQPIRCRSNWSQQKPSHCTFENTFTLFCVAPPQCAAGGQMSIPPVGSQAACSSHQTCNTNTKRRWGDHKKSNEVGVQCSDRLISLTNTDSDTYHPGLLNTPDICTPGSQKLWVPTKEHQTKKATHPSLFRFHVWGFNNWQMKQDAPHRGP